LRLDHGQTGNLARFPRCGSLTCGGGMTLPLFIVLDGNDYLDIFQQDTYKSLSLKNLSGKPQRILANLLINKYFTVKSLFLKDMAAAWLLSL
jgi:hypothetical protein